MLQFDQTSWSKMTQWGFSISTAAEASFAVFTVGRNLTTKTQQEESTTISPNHKQLTKVEC